MNALLYLFISIICIMMYSTANAVNPFLTEDPEPIDYKHWEVYVFSILNKNNALNLEPDLMGPALEMNWGPSPDLELHMIVPYAWSLPNAAPAANGFGDIEIGSKYRFIHETDRFPQLAIVPELEIPIGNAHLNLGNGAFWGKVSLSAQKSWGTWTTYASGTYAFNSAPYNLNFFTTGWELQRNINDHIILGGEIVYQTTPTIDSVATTYLNIGASYFFNQNLGVVFSVGHNIIGQDSTLGYLGLYFTGTT